MVPLFVINLDRATDRWQALKTDAASLDVPLNRITAVDGKTLDERDTVFCDRQGFRRRNGRHPLPGELGCYLSHRLALQAIVDSGAPYGVVMEDDVVLSARALERLNALVRLAAPFDVIKLMNHRNKAFVTYTITDAGDAVGRSLVGPNGSAAAYLVSRQGAASLLQTMATMTLPFDVELERAWARGQNLMSVRDNVFEFSTLRSQSAIATRQQYRAVKDFWLLRIPTAGFRTVEVLRRFAYSLSIALLSVKK